MTRSLPALAAIVAAVGGVWIHAATRDGSRPATRHEPTAAIEPIEAAPAPVPPAGRQAPAPDAKATARPKAVEAGPRSSPASGEAMRVARDPVTGELTTPEHSGAPLTIEQMQALARLEAQGLVTIRNADGSETLNHEGRFADVSVIRIGPDGRRVFQCAHGRSGAEHAFAAPATPNTEDR